MPARTRRGRRDVEKIVSRKAFANKLRRLADALENGDRYRLQIAGERISVPPDAEITLEHERGREEEEIEFQLRWKLD
ncbi:MAG: amphi-Trp domain-containing protein [bacterium]|nr:amphi-Trp domain-containing protein [bacterium]